MNLTKAILIVLVIILIVVILQQRRGLKDNKKESKTWDCVDRSNGDVVSVKMQQLKDNGKNIPEKKTHAENAEYFTQCAGNQAQMDVDLLGNSSGCDTNGDFSYAINEFGMKGMSYKDWVTSQAVDPQVIKNHAEFTRDRSQGGPQNITGRTYSPDSNDSYNPQPWVGIRGPPQAVPVCNPDQVSDMDYDLFPKNQKLIWRSSESQ